MRRPRRDKNGYRRMVEPVRRNNGDAVVVRRKPVFNDDDTKKRLNHAEQDAVFALFALADRVQAEIETGSLANRLNDIPRGEQRLKSCVTQLLNVATDIVNMAPGDQIHHMKRNLNDLRVLIYINKASVSKDIDNGRWLSYDDMNVFANAVRDKCMMCVKGKSEQRLCEYGKLLDKLPVDKPNTDGCGWMETLI